MIETADQRLKRRELWESWERGFAEGYESDSNQLPEWYFNTPPLRFTAYMKGFLVGREWHSHEVAGEQL